MAAIFTARPLLLVFPATTFALGTWQLYRLQWKNRLVYDLEQKLALPPVPLDLHKIVDLTSRRVQVRGLFAHKDEMLVGPRTHDGSAGHHVVTPLHTMDGKSILVNRGWISRAMRNPKDRSDPDLTNPTEQSITGIARPHESKSSFIPANQSEQNEWFWIDIDAMVQHVHSEPVVINALRDPTYQPLQSNELNKDAEYEKCGIPICVPLTISLRNQHLEYAMTWYSLTLASLSMIWLTKRGTLRHSLRANKLL